MERYHSVRALNYALILSTALIVTSATFIQQSQAVTASFGQPYRGRLENGVQFPSQFPGYYLRDAARSYTTPEVVGALLDAIEAVRNEFPDTCDIMLGDFSNSSGGSANHHRSHQNGRDVDIGMYHKGNKPLTTFINMTEDNLDAPKTWCLVENIIRSQRVQYIFLDRRVQKVLYDYAVTRGYDQEYLDRVFGNVRGSLIQHVRNHADHIHVRFFTPWSTLAAHIDESEAEKRMVIDMAQQSYLPKKVNYYVNGSEPSMDALAKSFGVNKRDLCRWNQLNPSAVPLPGSCLVFYKRSFESEPVLLARSLQPGFIAQAPSVRMASLPPDSATVSDTSSARRAERAAERNDEPPVREKKVERSEPAHSKPAVQHVIYKVQKGDTLDRIGKRNKMDVKLLCQLNGITKSTPLKPGQELKTSVIRMASVSGKTALDAPGKRPSSSAICFTSDPKKPNSPTAAYYTVGKGETLQRISRKSGISIDVLCQLNGLKRSSGLKPGQRIKLTQANLPVKPSVGSAAACPTKNTTGKKATAPAVKGKQDSKGKNVHEVKASVKTDPKAAAKSASSSVGRKESARDADAKAQGKSKQPAAKKEAGAKVGTAKKPAADKPAAKAAGKPAPDSKAGVKASTAAPKSAPKNSAEVKKGASAPAKTADAKQAASKPAPKKAAQPVGQLAKSGTAKR